ENNGMRQLAQVGQFDSSQTSIGQYRIHFGLGAPDERGDHPTLTVRWPDGTTQQIRGLAPNRLHTISRADGELPASPRPPVSLPPACQAASNANSSTPGSAPKRSMS